MELTEEQEREVRRRFSSLGGQALKKKYPQKQRKAWGKLGGRPRKNSPLPGAPQDSQAGGDGRGEGKPSDR